MPDSSNKCHWSLLYIIIKLLLLIRTFLYKTFSTCVIFLFDYFLKSKFWYMKFPIWGNVPRKSIRARIVEIILEDFLLNIASENSHSFDLLCFFLFDYWWDFNKYTIDLLYYLFWNFIFKVFPSFSVWILFFYLFCIVINL